MLALSVLGVLLTVVLALVVIVVFVLIVFLGLGSLGASDQPHDGSSGHNDLGGR